MTNAADHSEDSAIAPDTRGLFLTLFPSIMLPMFLAVVDQTIVATALPAIAASLGEVERVSWVVVSYLVATTIAAPLYGRFGDVFGRRRLMFAALAIFMVASLLCAIAPGIVTLSLARLLQGLGGGGLMTSSQALIGDVIPPRERGRYQGYLAAVVVCSSTFGPVAGGTLTEWFGWPSVFLVNLPIGAVAALLMFRLPAHGGSGEMQRFDYAGLALFVAFVVAILIAIELLQQFDRATLPEIAGLVALAGVALFALVRQERLATSPLLPLDLFRLPAIWRSDALAAFHGAALVSLITFLPIYLRVVRGETASRSGLLLIPLTAGIGVGSMVTGRLISRTGRTAIFPIIGLIVASATIILVAFVDDRLGDGAFAALFGINALFMGTVMGVVQLTVQIAAGPTMRGSAAGSVQFSRSVGAAFGTALTGSVLFLALAARDDEAAKLLGRLLEGGPEILNALSPARAAAVRVELADSFRAVFLTIASFTIGGLVMAWINPVRRVS